DRIIGLHQVLALDRSDLRVDIAETLPTEALGAKGGKAVQDVVELHPGLPVLVDSLERLEALEVDRVDLDGGEPRVESVALSLEVSTVGTSQALVDGDAVVLALDDVDLSFEDLGEFLVTLCTLMQRSE